MISIFKVEGQSMSPLLSGGDFLITSRFYRKLSIGDLIVFHHVTYGRLVKRIIAINGAGEYRVTGENDFSLSSKQMGWIAAASIKAKVFFKIHQKAAAKPLTKPVAP